MLVAELDGREVGLSHVALCPNSDSAWLEGIRVHPTYRRAGVATALMDRMIEYGKKKGARRALAIVAKDNSASQKMMEHAGFSVISNWSFYSIGGSTGKRKSRARIASSGGLGAILKYLERSAVYKDSAKMYVRSWHWYGLDRPSLDYLIREGRVIISGDPVGGIAVINKNGYWNRTKILQIVYLDSLNKDVLHDLLSFVTNVYLDGKYESLHVICHQNKKLVSTIEKYEILESEQFLLYSKIISG